MSDVGGVPVDTSVPSPNWPLSFKPQHRTPPLPNNTHVCAYPHATFTAAMYPPAPIELDGVGDTVRDTSDGLGVIVLVDVVVGEKDGDAEMVVDRVFVTVGVKDTDGVTEPVVEGVLVGEGVTDTDGPANVYSDVEVETVAAKYTALAYVVKYAGVLEAAPGFKFDTNAAVLPFQYQGSAPAAAVVAWKNRYVLLYGRKLTGKLPVVPATMSTTNVGAPLPVYTYSSAPVVAVVA